jgi:hypothetical protein
VWLLEGPADCLALRSTFENPAAVAVPGVWALKERWAPAFKDLCVFVVADRDVAGEKLRARCDELLGPVGARVLHVRVPAPYGDLDEWRRGCDCDNDLFFEALLQAVVEAEREAETSDA